MIHLERQIIRPGCYRPDGNGGCDLKKSCELSDRCIHAEEEGRGPLLPEMERGKMPGGKPRDPDWNWRD